MSELERKIPVVPLDPDRLGRIEARVMDAYRHSERRAPARSWMPAAMACAALLLVGGLGFWLGHRGGSDELDAGPAPVISTGPDQRSVITIGDATIALGPSTRLAVSSRASGDITVDLYDGRIDCAVTPRPDRPAFVVVAGDVDVSVVGTVFSVEKDDRVRVEVMRGKVQVSREGERVVLAAGDSWRSSDRVAVAGAPHPSPPPAIAGGGDRARAGSESESESASESESESESGSDKKALPPLAGGGLGGGRPAKKPAPLTPPPGKLPLADCSKVSVDKCRHISLTETGDRAAHALYTVVYRHAVTENEPADAIAMADLYRRRFQKRRPAEAAYIERLVELARQQLMADE